MVDLARSTMKLGRVAAASAGFVRTNVELKPEPFLGIGKMHFLGADEASLFEKIFGRAPPAPGCSLISEGLTVSWLAPGEWLLTGPEANVETMLGRIDIAAGDSGLVTDLTHARASFRLFGSEARNRLAALTPLDVSDTGMRIGGVARAPLGDTGMFLARLPDLDGAPCFRIVADQTMAAYVVRMLTGPSPASGAHP